MQDRGTVYMGLLLVLLGGIFLFAQLTQGLAIGGLRLGWSFVWPLFILLAGGAFLLPIGLWWERRQDIAGLVVPGTIITINGLILFFQNLTHDFGSWAYIWALEPCAVAVGLLFLYWLGPRDRGLLFAAGIVGGVGLVLLVIFSSILSGGVLTVLGPLVLILVGLLLALSGVKQRAGLGAHEE